MLELMPGPAVPSGIGWPSGLCFEVLQAALQQYPCSSKQCDVVRVYAAWEGLQHLPKHRCSGNASTAREPGCMVRSRQQPPASHPAELHGAAPMPALMAQPQCFTLRRQRAGSPQVWILHLLAQLAALHWRQQRTRGSLFCHFLVLFFLLSMWQPA